jgi:hypothetical protein
MEKKIIEILENFFSFIPDLVKVTNEEIEKDENFKNNVLKLVELFDKKTSYTEAKLKIKYPVDYSFIKNKLGLKKEEYKPQDFIEAVTYWSICPRGGVDERGIFKQMTDLSKNNYIYAKFCFLATQAVSPGDTNKELTAIEAMTKSSTDHLKKKDAWPYANLTQETSKTFRQGWHNLFKVDPNRLIEFNEGIEKAEQFEEMCVILGEKMDKNSEEFKAINTNLLGSAKRVSDVYKLLQSIRGSKEKDEGKYIEKIISLALDPTVKMTEEEFLIAKSLADEAQKLRIDEKIVGDIEIK